MTINSSTIKDYISNIFSSLWFSSFSPKFYKNLHQNGKGWGVSYFTTIYIFVMAISYLLGSSPLAFIDPDGNIKGMFAANNSYAEHPIIYIIIVIGFFCGYIFGVCMCAVGQVQ